MYTKLAYSIHHSEDYVNVHAVGFNSTSLISRNFFPRVLWGSSCGTEELRFRVMRCRGGRGLRSGSECIISIATTYRQETK